MKEWLIACLLHPCVLVGVGGALGCNVRYGLSYWQRQWTFTVEFPIATTIANIVGSLLIGFIAARFPDKSGAWYLFLGVGFCGGLTTFSSLALELSEHWNRDRIDRLFVEMSLNFGLGLVCCYVAWRFFQRSI